MLPIRDDQPRYSTPVVNSFLIGINLLIFLFEASLTRSSREGLFLRLGVVPAHVSAFLSGSGHYSAASFALSFLTATFLHVGWLHVIGNMWVLYIFGDNIEDYLGHFPYLLFYLVAGVLAMMTQVLFDPHSSVPVLGASGAIAGLTGAYFVLYPRARVLNWFLIPFYLPAWILLGSWFAIQLYDGLHQEKGHGGVAFWAHVGGFVVGAILIKLLPQRNRRSPYGAF